VKAPVGIDELLRAGHSDTRIAHELGCHRSTVNRHRHALQLPQSDRLGRIYAEALPTGRVPDFNRWRQPITPEQAAANRAALAAALRPAARPTRKAS